MLVGVLDGHLVGLEAGDGDFVQRVDEGQPPAVEFPIDSAKDHDF